MKKFKNLPRKNSGNKCEFPNENDAITHRIRLALTHENMTLSPIYFNKNVYWFEWWIMGKIS